MAAAYIAGAEVLYEWQEECYLRVFKIWCDVFCSYGMYFKGFSKAIPYWIFFVIIGS
jgi:hypothetical protein